MCVEEDHGIYPTKICKECWRFLQKPVKEKRIAHRFLPHTDIECPVCDKLTGRPRGRPSSAASSIQLRAKNMDSLFCKEGFQNITNDNQRIYTKFQVKESCVISVIYVVINTDMSSIVLVRKSQQKLYNSLQVKLL